MTFAEVWERFLRRDRRALARLLTWIARGEQIANIQAALRGLPAIPDQNRVIAFTGSGGVGKSTLVGKMIANFRYAGESVAVLACDPESPLTGGALLGDRLRMPNYPDDDGVYVRSLATPSGHEAVPDQLDLMVQLLHQFGFHQVLIETVGAGQGDTAVRQRADVLVVLVQPEAGDDVQWEKAGLLEVADLVVVHKADLPGADRTEAQVKALLNLPGCRPIPVLRVSSSKNIGLDELRQGILAQPSRRGIRLRNANTLLRLAQAAWVDLLHAHPETWKPILEQWQSGRINDDEAARQMLSLDKSTGSITS